MKAPLPPILWRIVGKSTDGMTVTLGKYRSREDADVDLARFAKEGFYRNVTIHEVAPPPPPPTPEEETRNTAR